MRPVCWRLTDSAVVYRGLNTMSTPRCQVESVRVPEAVWVSVVPPSPPAAPTARVYCTLAEPIRRVWTRLAETAGVRDVAPPISVMAGAPLGGPRGGRAPPAAGTQPPRRGDAGVYPRP